MPLNPPKLDSRSYRELPTVAVFIIADAITFIYPDTILLAIYLIQSSASAARAISIQLARTGLNAILWGAAAYVLIRVSKRLRHKNR
jgi:type IV secretory pathway VirB3-like protein